MNPEVMLAQFGKEDVPAVTSLNVAEVFNRKHRTVLQAIRELECDAWFLASSYINGQGKKQPMYVMTRDGFMLLVMGFTGKKATQFKVAYIKAFNHMEEDQ